MADEGNIRRRSILRALRGGPKTVRDIAPEVGLASTSTVHAHLIRLRDLGLVRHVVGWELTESGRTAIADGRPTKVVGQPRLPGA